MTIVINCLFTFLSNDFKNVVEALLLDFWYLNTLAIQLKYFCCNLFQGTEFDDAL